jgi:nitrogen regulatory protein P-II 1
MYLPSCHTYFIRGIIMDKEKGLKLVITIVKADKAEEVIDAFRRMGVAGWSITRGRGTSLQSYKELFGLRIEPEKEIIFTLIPGNEAEKVMNAAVDAGRLNEPDNGLSFIVDVENAKGMLFNPS